MIGVPQTAQSGSWWKFSSDTSLSHLPKYYCQVRDFVPERTPKFQNNYIVLMMMIDKKSWPNIKNYDIWFLYVGLFCGGLLLRNH